MTSWYQKKIVPRLLNSGMGSGELTAMRRDVLAHATGVVLELGVGPGYNLQIYKNISKLYALEPSSELIEIAKSRAESLPYTLEFLNAPAENIPLPPNSVDTVVSTWTLCSVSDLKQVLREVSRVLRREGKFIFIEHGSSPKKPLHVVQQLLTVVTKHFTGNCHYDREIEKSIREAGFTIEEMRHPKERYKPLIYNYRGVATHY